MEAESHVEDDIAGGWPGIRSYSTGKQAGNGGGWGDFEAEAEMQVCWAFLQMGRIGAGV